MRIASHPLLIPPYVMKEAERKVQPADRAISVTQVPGQPFGAPLYRVALAGYTLSAPRTDWNPVVDVLRNVSTMVAEHCGIRGVKIATAVIWLSVDLKTLLSHIGDPKVPRSAQLVETERVAGEFAGVVGRIPGLEAGGMVETVFTFLADMGDSIHQGNISLNGLDLATYVGGETGDALKLQADVLKLQETLRNLAGRSNGGLEVVQHPEAS